MTAAPVSTALSRVEASPAIRLLSDQSSALLALLPDESAVRRFQAVVAQAIAKNPDLLNCTPDSVVQSVMEAASLGLEPTGAAGGAHLVPYNVKIAENPNRYEKRAQLIPDYRGVIQLCTGHDSRVGSMEARVVKEGDDFDYQLGVEAWVAHKPSMVPGRSAKVTTHVYSVARLRDGTALVDVMDRAEVEKIQKRGRSVGFSPWASDWDEMAKKTVIKRHSKQLPVPPKVRSLLVREDELAGDTEPGPQPAALAASTRTARLAARLAPPESAGETEQPEAEDGQFRMTPIETAPQSAPEPAAAPMPADIPVVPSLTLCGSVSPVDAATCGIAADVRHSICKQLRDGQIVQTWPKP